MNSSTLSLFVQAFDFYPFWSMKKKSGHGPGLPWSVLNHNRGAKTQPSLHLWNLTVRSMLCEL